MQILQKLGESIPAPCNFGKSCYDNSNHAKPRRAPGKKALAEGTLFPGCSLCLQRINEVLWFGKTNALHGAAACKKIGQLGGLEITMKQNKKWIWLLVALVGAAVVAALVLGGPREMLPLVCPTGDAAQTTAFIVEPNTATERDSRTVTDPAAVAALLKQMGEMKLRFHGWYDSIPDEPDGLYTVYFDRKTQKNQFHIRKDGRIFIPGGKAYTVEDGAGKALFALLQAQME